MHNAQQTGWKQYAAAVLALALLLGCALFQAPTKAAPAPQDILRLHIIASSDGEEDQRVKLAVRDAIVARFGPLFSGAADRQAACALAEKELSAIEETARQELARQGRPQQVRASLSVEHFPSRLYDGVIYPEGEYQALRVVLGEGAGKNWWCVMFPPLCFADIREDPSCAGEDAAQQAQDRPAGNLQFRSYLQEKWSDLWGWL